MKLIFPYDNDNIYTGTPVELYPDSETGDYVMPPNAAGFPPEINGEGMWRPFFDEEKQEWVETADEAYKESLKKIRLPIQTSLQASADSWRMRNWPEKQPNKRSSHSAGN